MTSANGQVRDDEFMLGFMVESSAIVNDASTVFGKILVDVGVRFCMAGAVFGDVGG